MNVALKGKEELLLTNSRFRIKKKTKTKPETRCRRKRNTRVYQTIVDNLLYLFTVCQKNPCAHYIFIFIVGELPATEKPTRYVSLQNMYWSNRIETE